MLTHRPTLAGRTPGYAPGISSPWGWRTLNGRRVFHHGQDYFWLVANQLASFRIYSCGKGRVSRIEPLADNPTMGICVWVDHGAFHVRYCHMASWSVAVGQVVDHTTQLGLMGSTGTAALGQRHLHLEVWVNGVRLDPEPYFTTTAGGDAAPITPTRRHTMTTLFKLQGESLWALAGDSPGTQANWQETTGQAHANDLARVHGNAVPLAAGTWANRKAAYLAPVATTATIDSTAVASAVASAVGEAVAGALGNLPVGASAEDIAEAVAGKIPQPTARPFNITLTGEANPT